LYSNRVMCSQSNDTLIWLEGEQSREPHLVGDYYGDDAWEEWGFRLQETRTGGGLEMVSSNRGWPYRTRQLSNATLEVEWWAGGGAQWNITGTLQGSVLHWSRNLEYNSGDKYTRLPNYTSQPLHLTALDENPNITIVALQCSELGRDQLQDLIQHMVQDEIKHVQLLMQSIGGTACFDAPSMSTVVQLNTDKVLFKTSSISVVRDPSNDPSEAVSGSDSLQFSSSGRGRLDIEEGWKNWCWRSPCDEDWMAPAPWHLIGKTIYVRPDRAILKATFRMSGATARGFDAQLVTYDLGTNTESDFASVAVHNFTQLTGDMNYHIDLNVSDLLDRTLLPPNQLLNLQSHGIRIDFHITNPGSTLATWLRDLAFGKPVSRIRRDPGRVRLSVRVFPEYTDKWVFFRDLSPPWESTKQHRIIDMGISVRITVTGELGYPSLQKLLQYIGAAVGIFALGELVVNQIAKSGMFFRSSKLYKAYLEEQSVNVPEVEAGTYDVSSDELAGLRRRQALRNLKPNGEEIICRGDSSSDGSSHSDEF